MQILDHRCLGAFAMNYDVSWVAGDYSGTGNQFGVELIKYKCFILGFLSPVCM